MIDLPKDVMLEIFSNVPANQLINNGRFVCKKWNQQITEFFIEVQKKEFFTSAKFFSEKLPLRKFNFTIAESSADSMIFLKSEEHFLEILASTVSSLSDDELSALCPMEKKISIICLRVLTNQVENKVSSFEVVTHQLLETYDHLSQSERMMLFCLLKKMSTSEQSELTLINMQQLYLKLGNTLEAKEVTSKIKTPSEIFHACERMVNAYINKKEYDQAKDIVKLIPNQLFRPVLLSKIEKEKRKPHI